MWGASLGACIWLDAENGQGKVHAASQDRSVDLECKFGHFDGSEMRPLDSQQSDVTIHLSTKRILTRQQTSYHSYSGLWWTVAYWTDPIWWSLHRCWTCNGHAGDSIYQPLKRHQAEYIYRPFDRARTTLCSVQSANRTVHVFSYVRNVASEGNQQPARVKRKKKKNHNNNNNYKNIKKQQNLK